jgi:hypothetical protein
MAMECVYRLYGAVPECLRSGIASPVMTHNVVSGVDTPSATAVSVVSDADTSVRCVYRAEPA